MKRFYFKEIIFHNLPCVTFVSYRTGNQDDNVSLFRWSAFPKSQHYALLNVLLDYQDRFSNQSNSISTDIALVDYNQSFPMDIIYKESLEPNKRSHIKKLPTSTCIQAQ